MLRTVLFAFLISHAAFAADPNPDPNCDKTIMRPPEEQATWELISFLEDKKCWKSSDTLLPCLHAATRLADSLGLTLSIENFALSEHIPSRALPLKDFVEKSRADRLAFVTAARNAVNSANMYRERFAQIVETLKDKVLKDENSASKLLAAYLAYRRVNDPLYTRVSLQKMAEIRATSEKGTFVGYGVDELRLNGRYMLMPLPGGPADQAGIKRYDELIEANGVMLEGKTGAERLSMFDAADEVRMVVRRADGLREITVKEQEVGYMHEGMLAFEGSQYGYLQIARFPNLKDCSELAAIVQRFEEQGASGIVVDLRQNVGGQVQLAACLGGIFVGERSIAMALPKLDLTRFRLTGAQPPVALKRYFIRETSLPLAVLVDGASMSAAELWAGSMQELQRGWIVGEQTSGKGQWNTVLPHRSGQFGEVETVAEYVLPGMRSIHRIGVTPDFPLRDPFQPNIGLRYDDFFAIPVPAQEEYVSPRADDIQRIAAFIHQDFTQSQDPQLDLALNVLARANELNIRSEIKDHEGKWLRRFQIWAANRMANKLELRRAREAAKQSGQK